MPEAPEQIENIASRNRLRNQSGLPSVELQQELKRIADQLTYLTTEQGKPFTAAGFGNWFAERCIEAGVPGRAHGYAKLLR
jgi:hypothetical protein